MTPDLVIFDCDGVLVESEPISNQAMADNLARYGLRLTLAEAMAAFVGNTMPGVEVKAREMGATLPDGWLEEIDAEINARLAVAVEPVVGVPALLDRLDTAQLPYCVASNGSDAKMAITLGRTGLLPRVEGRIFSALTLGVSKPDPDLFEIAARDMGVVSNRAVVIEDSGSGALAAKRAGMRCFGYAPDGSDALAKHDAHIFRDMADLPGLLGLT